MEKNNKNRKNKSKEKIFVIFFAFLFSSLVFFTLSYFYFSNITKEGTIENYNREKLIEFLNSLSTKYNNTLLSNLSLRKVLKENFSFYELEQICNSLSTKKERILCVTKIKSLKRELTIFSYYLPYSLVIYENVDYECLIEENKINRVFLAQLLNNQSICKGDKECTDIVKKGYNRSLALFNLKKSYELYKRGFLVINSSCLN